MKEPKVAIIISCYNQEELVEKNIYNLKEKLGHKNYKIYFVDDSGKGNISKIIKKKFPFVKTIANKKNEGFSKSYNKGIKLAKKEFDPEWFIILNDDCEIREKDWLKKVLERTEKYPKTGIFGVKLIYRDGSIQWGIKNKKTYFFEREGIKEKDKEFSEDSETKEVIGAFMLIKKEVFENVGLFDEGFSPFYGEESDLCFRAGKKGWKVTYLGGKELIHYRNKSISKLSKEKVWFIKKKNSIRLEWRHYNFFKNIYYTLIHFGSVLKRDEIKTIKKLKLLMKAYKLNFKK